MKKIIFTGALLALVGIMAYAAQQTVISRRDVEDPVRLRSLLVANAGDAEKRVAAIEGIVGTDGNVEIADGKVLRAVETGGAVTNTVITAGKVAAGHLSGDIAIARMADALKSPGTIGETGPGAATFSGVTVGKAELASGVVTLAGTSSGTATLTVANDGTSITSDKAVVVQGAVTSEGTLTVGKTTATAGTIDLLTAGETAGKLQIVAVNNSANETVKIQNASHAQESTYTIPDTGASAADFVMTAKGSAQTIASAVTVEDALVLGKAGTLAGSVELLAPTSNQGSLKIAAADMGTTDNFTVTVRNKAHGQSSIYEIPDSGASADFVMTEGTQSINGAKTFGTGPVMSGANIQAGTIPAAAFDQGASIAALMGNGLGATSAYDANADGTLTNVGAVGAGTNRAVIVVAIVTEKFELLGGGSEPTFQVGEDGGGDLDHWFGTADFAGKEAGTVMVRSGRNTAERNIVVTAETQTGASTGAIALTYILMPEN
jgi:hypothetical protein